MLKSEPLQSVIRCRARMRDPVHPIRMRCLPGVAGGLPYADGFRTIGATGKTLVIDVKPDDGFARTARNIAGMRIVPSGRVTARDVANTRQVVLTKAAVEKLEAALGA